jgi:hypothetical protein
VLPRSGCPSGTGGEEATYVPEHYRCDEPGRDATLPADQWLSGVLLTRRRNVVLNPLSSRRNAEDTEVPPRKAEVERKREAEVHGDTAWSLGT